MIEEVEGREGSKSWPKFAKDGILKKFLKEN